MSNGRGVYRNRPQSQPVSVQGESDRESTIIDGQQRLATIGILSLAVIAKLHRMADREIDAERSRERAKELRLIKVEDELDAYTVFETLNARGLELTTADLLKSCFFSRVRVPADLEALPRRWQALIATVTPERFSDCLRYHFLCEQSRVCRERLFKVVRERVNTARHVFDLLGALEHRAELFAALADANHEYWMERGDVKPYVQALILFRARQVTPVLLAAWERFSPDDFARVLKLVTVVSFRYVVSDGAPTLPDGYRLLDGP